MHFRYDYSHFWSWAINTSLVHQSCEKNGSNTDLYEAQLFNGYFMMHSTLELRCNHSAHWFIHKACINIYDLTTMTCKLPLWKTTQYFLEPSAFHSLTELWKPAWNADLCVWLNSSMILLNFYSLENLRLPFNNKPLSSWNNLRPVNITEPHKLHHLWTPFSHTAALYDFC